MQLLMMMKSRIVIVLIFVIVSACHLPGRQTHEVEIKNVKEIETLKFQPHKSTYSAEIIVQSDVNNLFALEVSNGHLFNHKYDSLGMKRSDTLDLGDWYQNPMTLTYHGNNETEGEVSLKVIFYY